MVTAKKPAAEKPAAKKPGTSVAKWDEILKARALIAKKSEAAVSGGQFVSLKGGVLMFKGAAMKNNEMDCVVVASTLENVFYGDAYDPDAITSPKCFAFGRDEKTMAPHPDAVDPQHETCKGCPNNEFGSAEKGRGKACANVRRLALIPVEALDGGAVGIKDADVTYLKTPVTSSPAWTLYVSQLESQGRPPEAVVTQLSTTSDPKTQFRLNFKLQEMVDDGALLGALLEKSDMTAKLIDFPYKAFEGTATPAKGRKAAKPAAKATSKPAKRKFA